MNNQSKAKKKEKIGGGAWAAIVNGANDLVRNKDRSGAALRVLPPPRDPAGYHEEHDGYAEQH